MIAVKLMGGLGNQMFQYATAKRLAEKNTTYLRLDITGYQNMHKDDTPRQYELDKYKISGQVASAEELSLMLPQDFRASTNYLVKRRLGIDKRLRPLGEHGKGFNSNILKARNNTYLIGWWQNEKYFADIRDKILGEFTPKTVSQYSKRLIDDISANDSISIHVRRGDYVSNKFANKEHGLASVGYYQKSVNYLGQKIKSPRFFVFSDDLDWCKKSLKLGDSSVYVDGNGPDRAHEDIYLMQHCKHNIIANSSFSWWGGWLNDNPGKIVIAPKAWFQNKESNKDTEIVPGSWVRL